MNKKNITKKEERIIDGIYLFDDRSENEITYSHSSLCQTSLPFKDPKDQRIWKSKNGDAVIQVEAGSIFCPEKKDMVELGLPYGTKPRLILNHINKKAILTQSAEIEIESSLRGFMKRIGCDVNGRGYSSIKKQLTRFSASSLSVGRIDKEGRSSTTYGRVVSQQISFFQNGNDKQKVIWPNTVTLSESYFYSLMNHAVPLDENALSLIKDNSLQLDLYSMLAERLHRIKKNKPQFIPWQSLYEQYGHGFKRIRSFREKFTNDLKVVLAIYSDARVEEVFGENGIKKGIRLYNSPSPVPKKYIGFTKKKLNQIGC